jgi:radical SAM superfamily enzyme YgiQ (UPF0313 family)
MRTRSKHVEHYTGFEQGPIRPPSEARSLLIRVTRNCPWNRCTFCPVYKGAKFSIRPVDHVKKDIDAVHAQVERLLPVADASGRMSMADVQRLAKETNEADYEAFSAALHWIRSGRMRSVFLQDANSPAIRADQLIEILRHLKFRFPMVERITSYARSQTIAAKKDEDLRGIAEAGLNRIHIGLESGCDEVLARVQKGVTQEKHIRAGVKVKRAGMELSEYVMPGLGGRALSERHAIETADALNRIDPDFIRIRSLAIPPHIPLAEDLREGRFDRCTDREVAQELVAFLEHLDGIRSFVKSDHILNLFEDVEGKLPEDKQRLLAIPRAFLAMEPRQQTLFQVGRRMGIFRSLSDLADANRVAATEDAIHELGVTANNVDEITHTLMMRYL